MAALMPQGKQQYFTAGGIPLVGGKVYTYAAGTTTPLATYTTAAAGTPNTNPVILDSRGEASIFFSAANYKIVVKDSLDSTIWTQDNLAGDAAASVLASLAASTGSSLVGYITSGTGAVATTVQAKLRDLVSVKDFGAVGDGVTNDTAAIQAAIDSGNLVHLPRSSGAYITTAPLVFDENTLGMFGDCFSYGGSQGSVIDYTGPGEAIKVFGTSTHQVTALTFERFGIAVRTASAKGINFVDASYCRFKDIWIRLYASSSTGVYGIGNGLGSAPYYNVFDNVQVFGQTDGVTAVSQRGYWFEGDGHVDADGPNSNMISNIGRMAGLEVAFDIHSGNGNMFSNIGAESIRSYVFKIGNGVGAPGQADGNKGTNIRCEGAATCVFAKFVGQADNNVFTNYTSISLDTVQFDNSSTGFSNFCKPNGIVYTANFYAKNIAANATTKLDPEWTGAEGGITVPFNSVPYAMIVTVNRFAPGGLGSGVVSFYRSSLVNPQLTYTVNNATRFGGRTINTAPDVSLNYNSFDGINGAAQIEITTDAAWDQTTADINVDVIFLG